MIENPTIRQGTVDLTDLSELLERRERQGLVRMLKQRLIMVESDPRPCLETPDYLKRLREELPDPCTINYAGAWTDRILETAFRDDEIVKVDQVPETRGKGFFVQGRYGSYPFQKEVFDAVLFKDSHAFPSGIQNILRSVKPGGLVLSHNNFLCPDDLQPGQMESIPGLVPVQLPYIHKFIDVFRKVAA